MVLIMMVRLILIGATHTFMSNALFVYQLE